MMSEDRSRYYKLRLLDPEGNVVSKRIIRVYPEDEQGRKMAEMQGAMLGIGLGIDALHHAKTVA